MENGKMKTNLTVSRIILYVSFVLANVITTRISIRGIFGMMLNADIEQYYDFVYIFTIILSSGLSLLIFELVAKYYFVFTAFRKGHCLPNDAPKLVYKLRFYFAARNFVLALISVLYLFFPILYVKGNSLFGAVVTLAIIPPFWFDIKKNVLVNVDSKAVFDMTLPILIIEMILLVWGGL